MATQFQADELKIIGLAGPVFIRMLREKERITLEKIYGDFRNGKTNFLTLIAEYATVRDQIKDIESALRKNDSEQA